MNGVEDELGRTVVANFEHVWVLGDK